MKCEEALREEALRESSPKIRLTLTVSKHFTKQFTMFPLLIFFIFLPKAELFQQQCYKKPDEQTVDSHGKRKK